MSRQASIGGCSLFGLTRTLSLALAILFCANTGCSKTHASAIDAVSYGQRHSDPAVAPSTVRSHDQRAQRDFERGAQAWHRREYDDAQQRFESFLRDYPEDVLAPTVELWLVRTYLSRGDYDAGRRALRNLASDGPTAEVRTIAEVYLAFILQLEGDKSGARARIRTLLQSQRDVHIVEGIVPEVDTPLMAALLADTRLRERDFKGALQDLEVVERASEDDAMRAWAVSSGMTLARQALDVGALDEILSGASTFQRAVTLGTRIHYALDAGDVDHAAALFQQAGASLLAHDLEREYAALQNTLALSGAVDTPLFGLAISLQGPDRQAGRAVLRGMFLAQRSFEPRPRSTDLLIEDTRGTREGAQEAVRALCARGVPLIIGPVERVLADIVRDGAAACGAMYIGLETLVNEREDEVRMSLNARDEAKALVDYARARGDRTLALVTQEPTPAFFAQLVEAAQAEASRHGIAVVQRVTVQSNELQRSSERAAKQLRGLNADAILFAVSDTTMTALSSYLAAQGLWPRDGSRGKGPHYLATSFAWSSTLALNSSRYVQGMIVASWLPATEPRTQAFLSSYEAVFDGGSGVLEAFAFDAANLARTLLLDVGARDGHAMRSVFADTFSYRGATGAWSWRAKKQMHAPVLLRIDNGEAKSL